MALTLFILGDAAAALIGISWGRIKIGKKSVEGSLACFFVCIILFLLLFPNLPFLLDSWGGSVPLALGFITSLGVTLVELDPLKVSKRLNINDNLLGPVMAGLILITLYPFFK